MPYGMYFGNSDGNYVFLILAVLLASVSQLLVSSTFNKFLKIKSKAGLSGSEVARQILDSEGMYDVSIKKVAGNLSDHYDPRTRTVNLSQDVYDSSSIASISVAAHEVGHAIQHNEGYFPLNLRSLIAPVVSMTSQFVWILVLGGIVLSIPMLIDIGIIFFLATVIFQVVTLPVEFNASSRALRRLEDSYLATDEIAGSKKVLGAAAMTYVASTLVGIIQLIRLMGMRDNRR